MLSDSHRFFKNVVAFGLFAAPLLLLGSAVVSPPIVGDEASQLAVVARDPGGYYLFTLLIFVGTALLVPVVLGLMYLMRHRAPTLGNLGGSLAFIGILIAVGDALSQLIIWQMAAPGADQAQMAALLARVNEAPGAAVIFRIGGVSFVLGLVLLAIGLYRAKVSPVWVAAGLAAGAVLNVAGFVIGSNVVIDVSCVALLLSLGWIGRVVVGTSEQAWERLPGHLASSTAKEDALRQATSSS